MVQLEEILHQASTDLLHWEEHKRPKECEICKRAQKYIKLGKVIKNAAARTDKKEDNLEVIIIPEKNKKLNRIYKKKDRLGLRYKDEFEK